LLCCCCLVCSAVGSAVAHTESQGKQSSRRLTIAPIDKASALNNLSGVGVGYKQKARSSERGSCGGGFLSEARPFGLLEFSTRVHPRGGTLLQHDDQIAGRVEDAGRGLATREAFGVLDVVIQCALEKQTGRAKRFM